MTMQVFGSPASTCTHVVLLTAAELGLLDAVKFNVVNLMKGEQKQPDYIAKHPFGKVPYLVDEDTGISLYESRAIARFMATKAKAGNLLPLRESEANELAYLQKLAKFETAASVELNNITPHRGGLMMELYLKPMRKLEPDQERAAESKAALAVTLDVYDKLLSKSPYLAGDEYSLIDLYHIPSLGGLARIGCLDLITARPHVKKWWDAITSRAANQQLAEKFASFTVPASASTKA